MCNNKLFLCFSPICFLPGHQHVVLQQRNQGDGQTTPGRALMIRVGSCSKTGHSLARAGDYTNLPVGEETWELEQLTMLPLRFISLCFLQLWRCTETDVTLPRCSGEWIVNAVNVFLLMDNWLHDGDLLTCVILKTHSILKKALH